MPILVPVLPDRQYAWPTAADGVVLTLPGSAWSDSAPGELVAETDTACILTGIVVRPTALLFDAFAFEVDIIVNDVTVIATFRSYLQEVFANYGSDGLYLPVGGGLGLESIPLGARVTAVWRADSSSSSYAVAVSATYLKVPLVGDLLTTTNPLYCYPSKAAHITSINMASDTPWANGDAEPAGSGGDRLLVAISTHVDFVNQEWEIEVRQDGVLATTIRSARAGVSSHPNYWPLEQPLEVTGDVTVVCRTSDPPTLPLTIPIYVSMAYIDLPL